jgi:hypothetical protein
MEQTIKDKIIAYLKDGAVEYVGRFEHKGPLLLEIKHLGRENDKCGELYDLLNNWFNYNFVLYLDDMEIYIPEYVDGIIELEDINSDKIVVRISLHDTGMEWMERVVIDIDHDFLLNELKIDISNYDYIESGIDDIVFDFKIVKNNYEEPVVMYIESGNNSIPLNDRQQEILNDYVMGIVMDNAPKFGESFGLEDFVSASCEGDKIVDYDVSTSYITWDWDDVKPN